MVCNNCGARIPENNEICPKCGSLVSSKGPSYRTKEKPRRRKAVIILIICVFAVAALTVSADMVINESKIASRYDSAAGLVNTDPSKAKEEFIALGNYKDSEDRAKLCQNILDYKKAESLMDSGDFSGAETAFKALNGYKDSSALADKCQNSINYAAAKALLDKGDYKDAQTAFNALVSFNDSVLMSQYCGASLLKGAGDTEKALTAYRSLGSFLDSANHATECEYSLNYAAAMAFYNKGDYSDAEVAFGSLGSYNDSHEMTMRCGYEAADACYNSKNYYSAYTAFTALGDYKDSAVRAKKCIQNHKSGELYRNPHFKSKSVPVTMKAPKDGYTSYVKLYENSTLVSTLFITSGGSTTVRLPAGTYDIKMSCGTLWFGEKDAYGGQGIYVDYGVFTFLQNTIHIMTIRSKSGSLGSNISGGSF